MATLEKAQALKRIFSRVLKATFTKEELIYMRANGVSLTEVIEGGFYDDESRGDGQKSILSLMSRWPLDDRNDLLVVYGRDTANMICPRKDLGMANSDSLLENVADLPSVLVNKLADLSKALGFIETKRFMFGMDGVLTEDVDESWIETGEPQITFDRPETTSLFITRFSVDGSARWGNL